MRLYITKLKYKNFYSVFIDNSGYICKNIRGVDKSLHPFLIGRRDKIYYLDAWSNIIGLKDSFKIVCNVVSDRGKVLFLGGDISFASVLLCLSDLKSFNIMISPWDFSQIRSKLNLDLIVIHEADNISILESESKFAPYIVVNGKNIRGVSYPFNICLENPILANWYLYTLINSCRKGFYLRNKNYNEV